MSTARELLSKLAQDMEAVREYGADVQTRVGELQTEVGILGERVDGIGLSFGRDLKRHSDRLRAVDMEAEARDRALELAGERRMEAMWKRMEDLVGRIAGDQRDYLDQADKRAAALELQLASLAREVAAMKLATAERLSFWRGGKATATALYVVSAGVVQLLWNALR
jgi:hypothetical protein